MMARVLVIDDEVNLGASLAALLLVERHDATAATSAAAGLERLNAEPYDVVVSDIVMPGQDGIDLTRLIRERWPSTQVILMTGEPTYETASEAVRLGAFDYLAKPVRKEALLRAVQRAADVAKLNAENARMHAELRRHQTELETLVTLRTAELELALSDIVGVIARTVERRDPYTAGHQERVAALCVAIAREIGLPEETISGLRMAARVHDVGKIAVPAELLSKAGKLTPSEMGVIRDHVQAGFDVFQTVHIPWQLASIIVQHHERLDGSGYPKGLRGENVCVEARILGVADVVEAMASHRPYRPALGIDTALGEIQKGRGTVYWSEAVDACLRVFKGGFSLSA